MNSNFENYVTYFYKCSTITNICLRKCEVFSEYISTKTAIDTKEAPKAALDAATTDKYIDPKSNTAITNLHHFFSVLL